MASGAMEEIPPHPFLTEPILFVTNLPAHITDEVIARTLEFCVPFRPRLTRDPATGAATGSIEFRTIERAEKALATLNGRPMIHAFPQVILHLDPAPPSASPPPNWPPPAATPRVVSSLPPTFSDSKLFDTFRGFGAIASCRMHSDMGPDFGVVTFWREEDATRAEEVIHRSVVDNYDIFAPFFVPSSLSQITLPGGITHNAYPHGMRHHAASPPLQPFSLSPMPSAPLQMTIPLPTMAWSNGDGSARMVSSPNSERTAHGVPDSTVRATRGEEEEEEATSKNLETLMALRRPLDLTGQVVIPDFRFQAHGGLAVVYRGLWDDDMVAVKVLKFRRYGKAGTCWDQSNERRVRREINVWAALKHQNIVEFLGYSTGFADFAAMISPWCKLGTASDYLEGQELTTYERIRLAQDVSEGIQYLHQLKIVHGDVKPANILVSDEGVAKLCDFGLVRLADWEGPAGMTTTSPYTGTERYKALELFASPENRWPVATFEGDIYSLGSIMLEACNVWRFNNSGELRIAIADGYSPALRSETTHVLSEMTEFLWNLLEACWSEPSSRPGIGVVVDALGTFAQSHSQPLVATSSQHFRSPPSSTAPPSPSSTPPLSPSSESPPPPPIYPESFFWPLLDALEKTRAQVSNPHNRAQSVRHSVVGQELPLSARARLGLTFKEYVAAAARQGVVVTGDSGDKAWIAMRVRRT